MDERIQLLGRRVHCSCGAACGSSCIAGPSEVRGVPSLDGRF